jgi:hypothetical protein
MLAPRRPWAAPSVKVLLFGIVLVALVGFVGIALIRELTDTSQANARAASSRPVVATPRPAFTPDEEGYAQALWPIHNEVKLGALRMTMAGIQYKTNRIDAAALKSQVEVSVQVYREAEEQMGDLKPPPSFRPFHDEYLQAVRLYQQAGAEMVRLYDDNSEEHLLTAFPMSQEGGRILRRVGAVLWPNEYVPS